MKMPERAAVQPLLVRRLAEAVREARLPVLGLGLAAQDRAMEDAQLVALLLALAEAEWAREAADTAPA